CTPPVSLSNVTATTVILTLSLHDALPICSASAPCCWPTGSACGRDAGTPSTAGRRRGTELVLVDSHCHLDAAEFDDDRDRVIARARDAGVARQVIPATSAAGWPKLGALCAGTDGLFPAYGLHPM